VTRHGHA